MLVKGGHGTGADALDILVHDSETLVLRASRIETPNTHGTGCTLSAAVAALLARGRRADDAVRRAKAFVWQALNEGRDLGVGSGTGPSTTSSRSANAPGVSPDALMGMT